MASPLSLALLPALTCTICGFSLHLVAVTPQCAHFIHKRPCARHASCVVWSFGLRVCRQCAVQLRRRNVLCALTQWLTPMFVGGQTTHFAVFGTSTFVLHPLPTFYPQGRTLIATDCAHHVIALKRKCDKLLSVPRLRAQKWELLKRNFVGIALLALFKKYRESINFSLNLKVIFLI